MKCAFIADSIVKQKAGIAKYNTWLMHWLSSTIKDIQLDCIVPENSPFIPYKQTVIKSKNGLTLKLRLFTSIPNYINKEKFTLAIEPAHFGPFRLRKNVKRVTVIHDLTPISYPQFHSYASSIFHKWLIPKVIKNADIIITNSITTKKEIIERYKVQGANIFPLYPNMDKVKKTAISSIPSDYLLAIGTVEPRKNYSFLLNIMDADVIKRSGLKLIIIGGKGWKSGQIHKRFQAMSNVEYLGYVDEHKKKWLLENAQAYINTSFYEGLGLPVLEAMSYGKPLLLSSTKAFKELGHKGALFPGFNIMDWIKTILNLKNNEQARIDCGNIALNRLEMIHSTHRQQSLNLTNRILEITK